LQLVRIMPASAVYQLGKNANFQALYAKASHKWLAIRSRLLLSVNHQ